KGRYLAASAVVVALGLAPVVLALAATAAAGRAGAVPLPCCATSSAAIPNHANAAVITIFLAILFGILTSRESPPQPLEGRLSFPCPSRRLFFCPCRL